MRGGSEWKPLLFTSYASIVVGSPIIDTATALAMRTQCTTATIIGAYGLIDGLATAPLLGLLAG